MTDSAAIRILGLTGGIVLAFSVALPPAIAQPRLPPENSSELANFYQQVLEWQNCQGDSCTRVNVPLDYSKPTGQSISLAVRVIGSRELPSLITNPGGPGVGGVNFARNIASTFSTKIRSTFSIVGFDPRGTGNSSPINCLTGPQMSKLLRTDSTPDSPREAAVLMARTSRISKGCVNFSPGLASHIGTDDTVRDLDVLRAVLGNQTLNWLGFSYGSSIGARYTELFPHRVGRMVLDGAVNPALNLMQMSRDQSQGFQTSLRRYNKRYPGSISFINTLLARLDHNSMKTTTRLPLVQSEALSAIFYSMYSPNLWSFLHSALRQATDGDGTGLQELSYAANGQIGPSMFESNFLSAFNAINCWDQPAAPSAVGLEKSARIWSKGVAVPELARAMSWGNAPCTSWFGHSTRPPQAVQSVTEAPIVVIGTTFDPATPLRWAKALNRQLPTSDLLIYVADGHTAYLNGNACVDQYVDDYFTSGRAPGDRTCQS